MAKLDVRMTEWMKFQLNPTAERLSDGLGEAEKRIHNVNCKLISVLVGYILRQRLHLLKIEHASYPKPRLMKWWWLLCLSLPVKDSQQQSRSEHILACWNCLHMRRRRQELHFDMKQRTITYIRHSRILYIFKWGKRTYAHKQTRWLYFISFNWIRSMQLFRKCFAFKSVPAFARSFVRSLMNKYFHFTHFMHTYILHLEYENRA